MSKIQFRRGTLANLPVLDEGEPGWVKDTNQLYIGDGSINHNIGIYAIDALDYGSTKTSSTINASLAAATPGYAILLRPGAWAITAVVDFTGYDLRMASGAYFVITGAGSVTGLKEARPEWFGANTTPGTTDMSAAINNAINSVVSGSKRGPVYFEAQDYKVSSATINGALKSGIALIGAPGRGGSSIATGTRLLGYVTGKPTIDLVGSNSATIDGINIINYTSTIGILLGWDTGTSSGQFHTNIANLSIKYDFATAYGATGVSSNGGIGTIGIANVGGENVSYENVRIEAMAPMILSKVKDRSWIRGSSVPTGNFSSDYATLPTTWTCGVQTFSGDIALVAYGKHRPSLAINDANTVGMSNAYMTSADSGDAADGTYLVGVQVYDGYNNFLHFLSEGQDHAMEIRGSLGSSFQMTAKDSGSLLPAVSFYGGASGLVYGTDFKVQLTENRYAYGQDGTAPLTGSIDGCNLGSDQQYAGKVAEAGLLTYTHKTDYWGVNQRLNSDDAWITPTFSAGNFTASASMTWTVASGDVTTFSYIIKGKTMTLTWNINTSTVGGTPDSTLKISIPGSVTASKATTIPFYFSNNGTPGIGVAFIQSGQQLLNLQLVGGGNWSAASDTTSVSGQIIFEIN